MFYYEKLFLKMVSFRIKNKEKFAFQTIGHLIANIELVFEFNVFH